MFMTSTERHVQKSLYIESSHVQKKKNRESSHIQISFLLQYLPPIFQILLQRPLLLIEVRPIILKGCKHTHIINLALCRLEYLKTVLLN